ncbi:cysteine--tRNA ligase [Tabrizicola sp.]|uniref:cysteine--tRNA ligase n=1 Tax=Tabrizicola sp. TaxID=2005166 RepID=UPI003525A42B
MAIQLFDSLTREIRALRASHADGVFRFYNCGPTVYAPAHIGNFRTFVVNDVLRRLLELEFGADKVKHVRNLTDVDDRTIGQTQKEKRPLAEITQKWTDKFHADCAALNCLRPHAEPTATGYIKEQVNMIEVLMEKGNAYRAADGSVYFKIESFPGYGGLSRIRERELKITNAVADADHKDSVSDFALWKAYKPAEDGDVKWPGPRGASEGRPGWHIECSAMSKSLLGDTIDLHTGGVDLLFPHHENEIAQSACAHPHGDFAHYWLHNEMLQVEGKKMSKSLGNFFTVRDLLDQGIPGEVIRFVLLMTHYRSPMDWTAEKARQAEATLRKWRAATGSIEVSAPLPGVVEALADDLNTAGALAALHAAAGVGDWAGLKASAQLLGLLGPDTADWSWKKVEASFGTVFVAGEGDQDRFFALVKAFAEVWQARRAEKDYAAADQIKATAAQAGLELKAVPQGVMAEMRPDFDPAKLEAPQ